MTTSVAQIAAILDTVLEHDRMASTIAIRSTTKQAWPDVLTQRGRQFSLRWCESALAIREALSDAEHHSEPGLGILVLTPLGTHQIADDIIARLAKARILEPEGWEIVRQLFGATQIDVRLGRSPWMPQMLIDGSAQGAYAQVANGFLDLETAWRELLLRFLQLDGARPDATALLEWTMTSSADASLNLLPPAGRTDVLRWLTASAGSAGKMVLACVEAGRTGDAMALGLVCGVVYSTQGEGKAALGHAAIRLERFVNDVHVGVLEGRAWANAARQLLFPTNGAIVYRSALDRADVLLYELRIAEYAYLSDVLPSGLDQRMRAFAASLTAHAQKPTKSNLEAVEQTANHALEHVLAASEPQRADRIEMARRIARWLLRPAVSATTVSDFLCWQAEEGAFVDWARFRLLGGDELAEVSHAYEAIRTLVIDRRNALGRQFAVALQHWNKQAPGHDDRIVPLESVLDRVIAPLAVHQPVLLLVADGLSISIFRELFARVDRFGWTELVPATTGKSMLGVAVVPTITEVSRATLLCGKLTTGTASTEKAGFAVHPALVARSNPNSPPKLFHKGDLSDSTNLSSEVRAAISNVKQKVVGLVYNAVDDHLSGPDQLLQRWSLDDLRLLLPILREAKDARRIVIVTADHGHLLEDGTNQISGGESDRWRTGNTTNNDSEIIFSDGRVRTASGASSIACIWSESSRYAGRKNGYHGGVSPQEVAVPLSVFVPTGMTLPDWQAAPPAQPEWWDLPSLSPAMAPLPEILKALTQAPPRRSIPAQTGQEQLFDMDTPPIQTVVAEQDWIETLLQCQVYASQRALAARVAPADEKMRKLLSGLAERGGKLSRAALAQRLSEPEVRLNGILSAMRRVLNVDQAQILQVDESTGTIQLNRPLLLQQFRISIVGGHQ
ncbi:BREX-2 system phosphatase PglZ [Janthinobacterium lividum]|uniref:BREX-2 system phosphatase PglZ n=1 Tax=Janthinobacterium lividum TaxID=29581 RepID=A0A5C4NVX4_9BURK|nr:BREX-2 system phosphatase PglZ [Janthinobacterium lividum]TNC78202.1 BREX-2 system phosphatase PglZ [Janthinobacterium lividum]